jgi:ribosome-binding protein aMBF1 (putative translation factor)
MTLEDFLKDLPNRRNNFYNRCSICGTSMESDEIYNYHTSKGYICSDCYFQEFDIELEKFPIFIPRFNMIKT